MLDHLLFKTLKTSYGEVFIRFTTFFGKTNFICLERDNFFNKDS